MVFSLAPKAHKMGSWKIWNTAVSATESASSAVKQLPIISSARSLWWAPMAMEALGAPPMAIKELKALISVMMGKVMPTPVRAAVPISGICPM